jgi:predicted deacylase
MTRLEFDFENLRAGDKGVYVLTVAAPAEPDRMVEQVYLSCSRMADEAAIRSAITQYADPGTIATPVLAARGVRAGPTLVVTAGVHGDEYEGMEAIHRIFEVLDPQRMNGSLVAVPVVTLPAFWLGTRCSPLDLQNMARVFPGRIDGTPTERQAHALLERVLRHADLYVDLHSAGRHYSMVTMCGYASCGSQAAPAREAALRFGAPVVWVHESISPGRTISATIDRGIPSLYTEARGGGGAGRQDIECYTRGLANLLQLLGVADLSQAAPAGTPRILKGSGDLDLGCDVRCSRPGLFWAAVEAGQAVKAGELLGIVRSLEGEVVERITSPRDCVVPIIRRTPCVYAGVVIASLADEVEPSSLAQ